MNYCLTTYRMNLFELSINSLIALSIDLRAQMDSGLMSFKEFNDRINIINSVIYVKENENVRECL